MKKFTLILCLILFSLSFVNAQITGGGHYENNQPSETKIYKRNALTTQISSYNLVVIDYERLVAKKLGLSIGVLPVGGEITCNYHFKPQINSSSLGLKLGIDWSPITDCVSHPKMGFFYQYRSKKIFTFKTEAGVHSYNYLVEDNDFLGYGLYLDLRIGVYFPW